MMAHNFNNLTPKQTELLSMLAEEAGEIVQAVGKILRHGLYDSHPNNIDGDGMVIDKSRDNQGNLAMEVGDLLGVVHHMEEMGMLNTMQIQEAGFSKMERAAKYGHHLDDEQ